MLNCRVLDQSTPPTTSTFLSCHHSPQLDALNLDLLSRHGAQNTSLYFQSLIHVLPFAFPSIRLALNNFPTFGKKHRGVGLLSKTKFFTSALTPIESKRFANITSNLFRMKTFQGAPGWAGSLHLSFTTASQITQRQPHYHVIEIPNSLSFLVHPITSLRRFCTSTFLLFHHVSAIVATARGNS